MKQLLLVLVGVTLIGGGVNPAAQSKSASIQGVWQTVEITIAGASPRTITVTEPKQYVTIITAKHYSRTEVQAEAPRPVLADVAKATADELRAVWGPVIAEAGSYEVNGAVVTMHPQASKILRRGRGRVHRQQHPAGRRHVVDRAAAQSERAVPESGDVQAGARRIGERPADIHTIQRRV